MIIYLKYYIPLIYVYLFIIFPTYSEHRPGMETDYSMVSEITLETNTADTTEWPKPRFDQRKEDRQELVNSLGSRITDKNVREAMKQVPRHVFVPEGYRQYAYENRPLPIGHNQTISQPFVVAYMTQLLDLEAGEKVLEIGTGSGYQAAVLSELTPQVYTIEIVEALGRQARARLNSLGYSTIKTKIGDGYQGWKKHAPFDAIILTAAAPEIPQPLIKQLRLCGVLVAPIGATNQTQMLTKITKLENGKLKTEQMLPVRFVPLTGDAQKNN